MKTCSSCMRGCNRHRIRSKPISEQLRTQRHFCEAKKWLTWSAWRSRARSLRHSFSRMRLTGDRVWLRRRKLKKLLKSTSETLLSISRRTWHRSWSENLFKLKDSGRQLRSYLFGVMICKVSHTISSIQLSNNLINYHRMLIWTKLPWKQIVIL